MQMYWFKSVTSVFYGMTSNRHWKKYSASPRYRAVHKYWTILDHFYIPVFASGWHQHVLKNLNITLLGNTDAPEMFRYSTILRRSSIWDPKYTFSLLSFHIHSDNDTTRFWFKLRDSYFFLFMGYASLVASKSPPFWIGMVFILFNNYHMQKVKCLSQITSALLCAITVMLKT